MVRSRGWEIGKEIDRNCRTRIVIMTLDENWACLIYLDSRLISWIQLGVFCGV